MADTQALKRIYRRLARINTSEGTLSAQKTWLQATFLTRGTAADAGGFEASSSSFEGGSFAGLWRGSTTEDRALALVWALDEIDAEIAAAAAGTVAPVPTAVLMPRVICAPR